MMSSNGLKHWMSSNNLVWMVSIPISSVFLQIFKFQLWSDCSVLALDIIQPFWTAIWWLPILTFVVFCLFIFLVCGCTTYFVCAFTNFVCQFERVASGWKSSIRYTVIKGFSPALKRLTVRELRRYSKLPCETQLSMIQQKFKYFVIWTVMHLPRLHVQIQGFSSLR